MKKPKNEVLITEVEITLSCSAVYKSVNAIKVRVSECIDAFTLQKQWGIFTELVLKDGSTDNRPGWRKGLKLPNCWFGSEAGAIAGLPKAVERVRQHLIVNGWLNDAEVQEARRRKEENIKRLREMGWDA
jgi:hypothetical protein